jgi:hypothetical protein
MEFKKLYSLFEKKLYTDYLQKKLHPFCGNFTGNSFMALRIPVVSMEFSSFLIFAIKHFTSFGR